VRVVYGPALLGGAFLCREIAVIRGRVWSAEWHSRLLRTRRKRPRHRRAAEQRDERTTLHSRTSLARAMNTSDKETPSNGAVLRLTAM
jgi:hypothetical protein